MINIYEINKTWAKNCNIKIFEKIKINFFEKYVFS